MAKGPSSAQRRAAVAKQLRDKKGRWIEMGAKVRFLVNGIERVGEVVGLNGNDASVSYRGNNGKPMTAKINGKGLEVINSKASLPSPDAAKPSAPKAKVDAPSVNPKRGKIEKLTAADLDKLPDSTVVDDIKSGKSWRNYDGRWGLAGRGNPAKVPSDRLASDYDDLSFDPEAPENKKIITSDPELKSWVDSKLGDSSDDGPSAKLPDSDSSISALKKVGLSDESIEKLKNAGSRQEARDIWANSDEGRAANDKLRRAEAHRGDKSYVKDYDAAQAEIRAMHPDEREDLELERLVLSMRRKNIATSDEDRASIDKRIKAIDARMDALDKGDGVDADATPDDATEAPKAELPGDADAPEAGGVDDARRAELEKEIADLEEEEDFLKNSGATPAEVRAVKKRKDKLVEERDGAKKEAPAAAPVAPEAAPDQSADLADGDSIEIDEIDDLPDGSVVRLDDTINGDEDITEFRKDKGSWVGSNENEEVDLDTDAFKDYINSRDPKDIVHVKDSGKKSDDESDDKPEAGKPENKSTADPTPDGKDRDRDSDSDSDLDEEDLGRSVRDEAERRSGERPANKKDDDDDKDLRKQAEKRTGERPNIPGDADNDDNDSGAGSPGAPSADLPSDDEPVEAPFEVGDVIKDAEVLREAPNGTEVVDEENSIAFIKLPERGWRDEDLGRIEEGELAEHGARVEKVGTGYDNIINGRDHVNATDGEGRDVDNGRADVNAPGFVPESEADLDRLGKGTVLGDDEGNEYGFDESTNTWVDLDRDEAISKKQLLEAKGLKVIDSAPESAPAEKNAGPVPAPGGDLKPAKKRKSPDTKDLGDAGANEQFLDWVEEIETAGEGKWVQDRANPQVSIFEDKNGTPLVELDRDRNNVDVFDEFYESLDQVQGQGVDPNQRADVPRGEEIDWLRDVGGADEYLLEDIDALLRNGDAAWVPVDNDPDTIVLRSLDGKPLVMIHKNDDSFEVSEDLYNTPGSSNASRTDSPAGVPGDGDFDIDAINADIPEDGADGAAPDADAKTPRAESEERISDTPITDEQDLDALPEGTEVVAPDGEGFKKNARGRWVNLDTGENFSSERLMFEKMSVKQIDLVMERYTVDNAPGVPPVADGEIGRDANGRAYVNGGDGVAIFEGDRVKSSKDGLEGEVVKIEGNGKYVKVRGDDGKIRGRRISTLEAAGGDKKVEPNGAPSNVAPAEVPGKAPAGEPVNGPKFDENGRAYVDSASGDAIFEGATVMSNKDGLEGVVVKVEGNGKYVKVKGEDGKVRGRRANTLEVVVKVAADPGPSNNSAPNILEPPDSSMMRAIWGGDVDTDLGAGLMSRELPPGALGPEEEILPGVFKDTASGREFIKAPDGSRIHVGQVVNYRDKNWAVGEIGAERNGRPYLYLIDQDGDDLDEFLIGDDLAKLSPPEAVPTISEKKTAADFNISQEEYVSAMVQAKNYQIISRPDQGAMGDVTIVELPDGSQVVVKKVRGGSRGWGNFHGVSAAQEEVDAEYLSGKLMEALEVEGVQVSDAGIDGQGLGILAVKVVPGKPAVQSNLSGDIHPYGAHQIGGGPSEELMESDQAKKMALLDVLIGNGDRHRNNWFIDESDKKIYPIDHGFAWTGGGRNIDTSSPFVDYYFGHRYTAEGGYGGDPDIRFKYKVDSTAMNGWTKSELMDFKSQYALIEPEFVKRGDHAAQWYKKSAAILDALIEGTPA